MRIDHCALSSLAVAVIVAVTLQPAQAQGAAGGPLASCKADAQRICPGVKPGGGRIIGCLKEHQNDVTIGCAKELKAIKAKMGK